MVTGATFAQHDHDAETSMTGRLSVADVTSRLLIGTFLIILPLVLISAPPALALQLHWDMVNRSAVPYTPELVPTTTVPKPRVDTIAQVDNTIFAGGLFDRVAMPGGSSAVDRRNVFAFDSLTGELKTVKDLGYRDPEVDGQVWAIEANGNSIFVGGKFTSVNGVARRSLVKIDAKTAQHHIVCDAASSFDLADDTKPVWINYTGGNSVWAVAATGAAVNVQRHIKWLDNPNGHASRDGGGAVQRYGIGAIDSVTGKALPWNSAKPAQIGGKAFLATSSGLWVSSDSVKFDGEPHRGIAFEPVPLVMIGAGDIASCSVTTDEVTADLEADAKSVVFTLGDNAYQPGTTAEFVNFYGPSWGAFKDRTRPSPGERDYLTPDAAAYFNYFGASAGSADKGYYSYDVGGWHILVLNSMCERVGGCGGNSPMIIWLKADLEANTANCMLAYFHHPLFSSGVNGNNIKMKSAWNALYAARTDVIISAHDNNYERFAPQRPDGAVNSARSIRQFDVGTGGAALGSFGTVQPNSEVRNNDTFGVLRLKLGPSSYQWNFLPTGSGVFTDSGTENCH